MSYSRYYGSLYGMDSSSLTVAVIIGIALVVLLIAAEWRLFTKAGEKGWKCLIPIYSGYVFYKITWSVTAWIVSIVLGILSGVLQQPAMRGETWASALVTIIGLASLVLVIIAMVYTAKAYGKGGGFAVGLLLLTVIFLPILAFGSSQYIGPKGEPTYLPREE